jgi:hypothetical protein
MLEGPAQKWGGLFHADIKTDNIRLQMKYFIFGFVA